MNRRKCIDGGGTEVKQKSVVMGKWFGGREGASLYVCMYVCMYVDLYRATLRA